MGLCTTKETLGWGEGTGDLVRTSRILLIDVVAGNVVRVIALALVVKLLRKSLSFLAIYCRAFLEARVLRFSVHGS